MPKYRVMLAQFPGGNSTHVEPPMYYTRVFYKLATDPTVGPENVMSFVKSDTPITMTRNQALAKAQAENCDYCVMIDSDMHPDCISPNDGAKPFWETSWDFIRNNKCGMIAAPYCGPPPEESVYIFRWQTQQDQRPNVNMKLEMYDRHTASTLRGIQEVAALPTGLCIIDMRAVKELKHPWFDYEWKDRYGRGEEKCPHCCSPIPGERMDKASTEDVYFSRNLWYAGWPVHCNWDAWAGHYKQKLVGPPQRIPVNAFPQMMREWAKELPPAKIANPYPELPGTAKIDVGASDIVPTCGGHAAPRFTFPLLDKPEGVLS